MPTFRTFIVDKTTKKVKNSHGCNTREYWKGGKYEGTIDMIIEVFATDDHLNHAIELYNALKSNNLQDKYFSCEIHLK